MTAFQTLLELETFYDKMFPALEKSTETFAWFSGIPHPFFNAVMHLFSEDVENKIEQLISESPIGIPISFWVHDQKKSNQLITLLLAKKFHLATTCFLMTSSVYPITELNCSMQPANLEVFHNIMATVFHFDEVTKNGLANLLSNLDAENYILYLGNLPIGTGTLVPNKTTGGIFNIAILPEYQRQGHGRTIMQFLTNRAHTLGLKKLLLLSSPASKKLYSDLHFTIHCDIDVYIKKLY